MALALLASRNESYFGEQKVYTRKNSSSNPNPKHCPNPNFNCQIAADSGHESDRRPQHDLDEPAAASSDDSSSFDRNPADLGHRRDPGGGYVTFNISSYSRKEQRDLKRRLEVELEQIRSVSSRIEIQSRFAASRSAALPAIPGSDALMGRSPPPQQKLQIDEMKKLHTGMMNKCGQMLSRLMKHKGGSWFNFPVDVRGMGLHDYHLVVKNPMDLGTVKSKLGKGLYAGPFEFASDIRLTFNNALTYNPKGHFVHNFADQLLKQFETCFRAAYAKYDEEEQRRRAASLMISVPPTTLPVVQSQLSEPNQRVMSLEEKERLGYAIQSLPDAKMAQVLHILSNRKNVTWTNGDEVEIDFEAMDNETLWELDRFVVEWNKTMIRMKKRPLSLPCDAAGKSISPPAVAGEAPQVLAAKKSFDEDVDIGDEMPVTHYPSVEIDKDSSSVSDSSSSSDSDSGSSSGSESDDDDDRQEANTTRCS